MKVVLPSQTSPREGIQRVSAACFGGIRRVFVGIRGYPRVSWPRGHVCIRLTPSSLPFPSLICFLIIFGLEIYPGTSRTGTRGGETKTGKSRRTKCFIILKVRNGENGEASG